MPDEADFSQRLRNYQKALKEEFEANTATDADPPEVIAAKARKMIILTLPELIQKANLLALGASSESVSLQAIRFLYGIVVPATTRPPGEPDPMDKLIADLMKTEKN